MNRVELLCAVTALTDVIFVFSFSAFYFVVSLRERPTISLIVSPLLLTMEKQW